MRRAAVTNRHVWTTALAGVVIAAAVSRDRRWRADCVRASPGQVRPQCGRHRCRRLDRSRRPRRGCRRCCGRTCAPVRRRWLCTRRPRRTWPRCCPRPLPRHLQRRRVVHEVEQVAETAARIGHRPAVQLGLHPRYPCERPGGRAARSARIHQRVSQHCSLLAARDRCRPSPCDRLSLPPTTTAAPPRPGPIGRRRTQPAWPRWKRGQAARTGTVPRVHCDSLDEGGARFCPCGIATATPQHFTAASGRTNHESARSSPPSASTAQTNGCAPLPAHIRQVRGRYGLERFSGAGSSRTPLRHACRARAVWQCQHAPAVSGLLPPSPHLPDQAALSYAALLRQGQRRWSLTPAQIDSASRRTG